MLLAVSSGTGMRKMVGLSLDVSCSQEEDPTEAMARSQSARTSHAPHALATLQLTGSVGE